MRCNSPCVEWLRQIERVDRILIIFSVNYPSGSMIVKRLDASTYIKDKEGYLNLCTAFLSRLNNKKCYACSHKQ